MLLPQPFNPMQYEPSFGSQGGFPTGNKMPVVITEHNVKPNSQNTGGFLEIVLTIIDGPHKGATGKHRFNLFHTTSAQAVEIAHKEFTAFCHAMGYLQPISEIGVLHNLPFLIDAGPQTTNPQYTEIKAVYNMQGVQFGASKTAVQAPAQQQQAPGFGAPAQQFAPPAPVAPAFGAPQAPAQTWQPNAPVAPQAAPVAPPQAPQAPVWTPPQAAPAPAAPPAYQQPAPVYQQPQAAPAPAAPVYQPQPGSPMPPWGGQR